MGKKPTKFDEGIVVKTSTTAPSAEGEIRNKDSKLQTYIEGAERDIVTDDQTQTLENKTIDGTSATGNNTVTTDADQVTYDNTTSGLTATNSQDAVDEVEARLDTAETNITTNASNLSNHLVDATDAHDASAISNVPSGNLASTDVQSALNELQTDIDTRALDADLTAHISDAVDAHDASAISNVPSGNLIATDVQTALNELQTDIDTRALDTDLDAHINDITDAHDASAISFDNVTSGLTATEVQSAIDEVEGRVDTAESNITTNASNLTNHLNDTVDAHDASAISYDNTTSGLTATETQSAIDEVEGRLDTAETGITTNASDLADHEALTSGVHGVTGSVVGTTDTQTLTNKTITGASIQSPTRLDAKKDTLANLETYALTATNGEILHATDTDQYFGVVDGALVPLGGGGGGGLDVFYAQDFEDLQDVSDFSTGNNATFLGGGTIVGTLALETGSPIASDKSLSYTQASGSLNDYFASESIPVDSKQQGNVCAIKGYYRYDGNADDIRIVLYDVTNATLIDANVFSVKTTSQDTLFQAEFRMPATCANIRWGAQVKVENIGAELVIDDVELIVDPRAMGEWIESESSRLYNAGGLSSNNTNAVYFGSDDGNLVNTLYEIINDSADGCRLIAKRPIDVDIEFTHSPSVSTQSGIALNPTPTNLDTAPNLLDNTIIIGRSFSSSAGATATASFAGKLNTNDELYFMSGSAPYSAGNFQQILSVKASVNRRSITIEAKNDIIEYTPTFQGFGTVTNINAFYTILDSGAIEIWGEATAGTVTASEAQISLPNNALVKGSTNTIVAGVWGRSNANIGSGGLTLITNDDDFINLSSADTYGNSAVSATSPALGSAIVANNERFSWRATVPVQDTVLKRSVVITLDDIRDDGEEYEVFGEFIWVGTTKYQKYRRSYNITTTGTIDTLPTTYEIIDPDFIAGTDVFIHFATGSGSSSNFVQLSYSTSTGNLVVAETTYTLVGTIKTFEYYDTDRPLN